MPAYVIADLSQHGSDEEIAEYRSGVPGSLEPFGGRFVVRGGKSETVEGGWEPGRMVVIEFPDVQAARDWYTSPAYQAILPLRTRNCDTKMIIVEGA
jgi:uncharacterized protein (DUF1330 family)